MLKCADKSIYISALVFILLPLLIEYVYTFAISNLEEFLLGCKVWRQISSQKISGCSPQGNCFIILQFTLPKSMPKVIWCQIGNVFHVTYYNLVITTDIPFLKSKNYHRASHLILLRRRTRTVQGCLKLLKMVYFYLFQYF